MKAYFVPLILLVIVITQASSNTSVVAQTRGLQVIVIAPSISTSIEARTIRARLGWTETSNWLKADAILVVVRSSLSNPLNPRYDCACELKVDADRQLNISGPRFHVYAYQLREDLSVIQMNHISYEARD